MLRSAGKTLCKVYYSLPDSRPYAREMKISQTIRKIIVRQEIHMLHKELNYFAFSNTFVKLYVLQ